MTATAAGHSARNAPSRDAGPPAGGYPAHVVNRSGFTTAGILEVLMPTGWRVRGVIPNVQQLARHDRLTPRAFEAAQRFGDRAWREDPANLQQVLELTDLLVATFPRAVLAPGSDEWVSVRLAPEDVETMDAATVGFLEDIVLGVRTADEVTALSQALIDAGSDDVDTPPDVPRGNSEVATP